LTENLSVSHLFLLRNFRGGRATPGPAGPAPARGQHTAEVLAGLGLEGEEAIARLALQGAFGPVTKPKL
jgi:crotonobetainyl-CoA:carnitine CoA-transferase CaiB-like acyl-CoA transferase